MKKRFWVSIGLFIIIFIASSWGFLIHRTINQLAIYSLPQNLRAFFYTNKDSLIYNAPRPDQRRNTDPTEGNKHFLDFEYFGDDAYTAVPHSWEAAVEKYSADTLKKYGTLPFVIVATQKRLTEAFRRKDADSIIFYATDLGHYIGDAHVPLHTSLNYDGQLTNQRGIHDLWETTVPETELTNFTIKSKHKAKYLQSPQEAIWSILQHTHSLLPSMFEAEKEVSKNFTDSTKYRTEFRWGKQRRFYTPGFAMEYNKALQPSINEQMINAANALSNFWYTAWVDAGKPDLHELLKNHYTRRAFKKERRAYRKNRLIEKGMLISQNERTKD